MTEQQTLYKLHNRSTGLDLKSPRYGLWITNDFSEAKEMLEACREFLRLNGLDKLISEITIETVE